MRVFAKIKDIIFGIFSIPFALFASTVIRLSGADHDTWPSFEEMRSSENDGKE